MAEAQLQQFRQKVRQLNAFVALCDRDPALLASLRDCDHHDQVVALARRCGFEIGRRWGEAADSVAPAASLQAASPSGPAPSAWGKGSPPPADAPTTVERRQEAPEPAGCLAAEEGLAVAKPTTVAQPLAAAEAMVAAGPTTGWLALPCPPPGEELTEVVLHTPQLRLERIHSCSAISPEGFWYEQEEHEWVLLLQGSACLQLAAEVGDRLLHQGDSLHIPAGCRHRVKGTDPYPGTIWLALFWRDH